MSSDFREFFRISYLLRLADSGPKVVAFVLHEDQEDTMRAHGPLDR